ncbi:MAG: phytanoyl-CoA dioxygenase family protein [Burkholderiales bacterium]|nr:phytanoyl-CoA dioxygenase family protein [Burkholderiales bacterium]
MRLHAPVVVSDDDRATYERDGVVCLRHAIGADWLAFLADAVEEAMASPGPHAEEYEPAGGAGRFFGDIELAQRLPKFRRFALASPAAEIAGRIMGASRVNFFYDQLLVKEPGTSARTPWHQDQPYWAVSGYQVCSLWIPLDPVPEDVGVEYVCGSHRWPEFSPYHFADGSPYAGTGLPPLPDIEADRARYDIRRFALEPGDCLVFQAMIVHGAPGNRGRHRRRALATRWAGDDARYRRRAGEVAIPTEDPGLAHGARLDCERFPLVWTAPS